MAMEAGDKGHDLETPNPPDWATDASRTTWLRTRPAMSSSVANIESLVYSLVPQARVDDNLKRELVDHCKDILSR